MRLNKFRVGRDARNRTLLSPFGGKTGRNQPSTTEFIFGSSFWLRGLIKPAEGWEIAYIDWAQQEFGIAAALSGDQVMHQAYALWRPLLVVCQASWSSTGKCDQEIPSRTKGTL